MTDVDTIRWVADQLIGTYGKPSLTRPPPLETLVLTILSQNTTDQNRDRAFSSLMQAFGGLDAVREATLKRIASAIRTGGLQEQKARSIRAALRLAEQTSGGVDLSFLEDLSLSEAMAWLRSIPGVGPKTAAIVLLFSFRRPVFPVDTHIRRVMMRMGLVTGGGDPHRRLNQIVPPEWELMQQLHLLTIQLGRQVCRPASPRCTECPIAVRCAWATATHRVPPRGEKP
jgi:endonuclease III